MINVLLMLFKDIYLFLRALMAMFWTSDDPALEFHVLSGCQETKKIVESNCL